MKDGKLFGKINIIDLLILIIIAAALIFVGLRYLRPAAPSSIPAAATSKVRMTFFAPDAPILFQQQEERQLGKPVSCYDTKDDLGVLVSFEPETAYSNVYDPETQELVKVPANTTCWLTFASECNGTLTDDGLYINGTRYCIGGSYTICAGQTRIYCRLADVALADG